MNNRGENSIFTILVTVIITALLCFIFFRLGNWNASVNGETTPTSSTPQSISDLVSATTTDGAVAEANMYKKFSNIKKIIDNEFLFDYDQERLADNAARGMLYSLDDPYATYYNKDQFKSFYEQTEGEYVGIGVYISFDTQKELPIILAPLDDSPALEAGILPGDYILKVGDTEAGSNNYQELVDAIKGTPGSTVKIELYRYDENGKGKRIELEIERKKIELNPVVSEVYEESIGYIRLTSFDENTYDNFKAEYDKLIDESKVKALIIDLRDNPGGVLGICAKITDLMIPEGKIVYTVDKKGKEEALFSDDTKIKIPLVVLVNENSASASEVFTAAIKDYGVGTIIGKKTFGKGVIQTLKSLGDGTYLKITTAEYFSPKGNKINGEGVTPDIEVDLPETVKNFYYVEFDEDTQLQRAIEELKSKM